MLRQIQVSVLLFRCCRDHNAIVRLRIHIPHCCCSMIPGAQQGRGTKRAKAQNQRCQEACLATQNVRCQGCRAEQSTLKPSSLVSVKECQGSQVAVCQGVRVLSRDIFPQNGRVVETTIISCTHNTSAKRRLSVWYTRTHTC